MLDSRLPRLVTLFSSQHILINDKNLLKAITDSMSVNMIVIGKYRF